MKPPATLHIGMALISILITVPLIWHFYWPAGGGLDVTGHQLGRDFINLWAGPQLAFAGRGRILTDFPAYHQAISELFGQAIPFHNWSAPPFMLILLWPFAQAPYFVAFGFWTVLTLAAYLLVALSVLDRDRRLQGLLLLALSPAAVINVIGGQNGFLTASLFLGGFLVLERRPRLAGVLFGLLTVKPHLGLVIPIVLLRTGAWRAIISAGIVILLLVIVSAATFGLEIWRSFLLVTSAYQTAVLRVFEGFYTYMMGSVFTTVRTFGGGAHWAMIIQIAVALPVAMVTTVAFGRTKNPILRLQLIASATFLITPYLFIYDMTWTSAVAVWRILSAGERGRPAPLLYILIWLSPGYIFQASFLGVGLGPVFAGAMFLAALQDIHHERRLERPQAPKDGLSVDPASSHRAAP
jgi:Glycosyltransferase family 87